MLNRRAMQNPPADLWKPYVDLLLSSSTFLGDVSLHSLTVVPTTTGRCLLLTGYHIRFFWRCVIASASKVCFIVVLPLVVSS
jgi:hypothetical protein